MRSTIIDIYKASQADRIKLYDHLNALGEKIYSDTGLRNSYYDCSKFDFASDTNKWSGSGVSKDLSAISINEFIKKFPIKHQYKPGDSVKIRSDLKEGDSYTVYINNEMVELAGKIVKIASDSKRVKDGKTIWKIKQDNFDWTDDLFEPISVTETPEKEPEMDIKVGDIYKNSAGNLNTITRVVDKFTIYYTVSTGREYSTQLSIIERNWKKVLQPVETTQSTTVSQYLNRTIKTGDYVERVKHYDTKMSKGSIWKVRGIPNSISIEVIDGRGCWDSDNFKVINPEHPAHPDYTASVSTPTPTKTLTGFRPVDRVKVRSDLSESKTYRMLGGKHYTDTVNPTMLEYAGKIVTIASIDRTSHYYLKECRHNWVDEMFDGLESEQTLTAPPPAPSFQIGDKVRLKDDLKDATSYNGIPYFDTFKFHIPAGIISKIQETSVGKQYYIDKIWYGEDALELDTSSSISQMKITAVKSTTTGTPPIAALVSSAASAVSIKKFDGVTVTPLGGTNQPTIKSEKKSMAKAIKETAMVTLDQNKQAAIIAGKMEAGRILTKQVLKQIKPHIPMFVRGYLDTPLAPVVVANLVAAVGNHTQNKRVQQVSELMLLAAADATVQSFNLDKIIDDVLAGVKLPAGILTSDEE